MAASAAQGSVAGETDVGECVCLGGGGGRREVGRQYL